MTLEEIFEKDRRGDCEAIGLDPDEEAVYEERNVKPRKYTIEHAKAAYALRLLGWTYATIAEEMGISRQTLYNWRAEHPDFDEALNNGGAIADAAVADSLFRRAKGYISCEKTAEYDDAGKLLRTKVVEREIPPDVAAQKLWLSCRQSDVWKDRQTVEVTARHTTGTLEDLFNRDKVQAIESGVSD